MTVVAIIAEYNPFHNGHLYQINRVRELFGEDTAIIAIMSGNFTQRGELAITDKTIRARAAVLSGVNLVLELPYPFSSSSAEFFARAGVSIATKLGVVDYLVFGSELGDISRLKEIAAITSSEEFKRKIDEKQNSSKSKKLGYPKLCELVLGEITGKNTNGIFSPNNILAIEYIKAIDELSSSIKPITITRSGANYNDEVLAETELQSAYAIRELINESSSSALDFVPLSAKSVLSEAISNGKISDIRKLDNAIISYFRLNSPQIEIDIHDAAGGLYNRLCEKSATANSISELTEQTETKRYTRARIRRVILNSYFGVTSSAVRTLPLYTQLLGTDDVGRALLRKIKKMTELQILTKPSSYGLMAEEAKAQKELSDRADSVYALTLKKPNSGNFSLKFTPFVKEGQ